MLILLLIISLILAVILTIITIYYVGMLFGLAFGAPYVPTPKVVSKQMVEIAKIKKGDTVYDLGCGDGRLLFLAEKKGANGIGVEITPQIYLLARFWKLIKKSQVEFRLGSMFGQKDIHRANVLFVYTSNWNMRKIYKKIYPELKKGTKIIVHAFPITALKPQKIIPHKKTGHDAIYYYVKK